MLRAGEMILKHCIQALLVMSFFAAYAQAVEQIDVTRLDAIYLDRAINLTVEWQSVNPVLKVSVSAAHQNREIVVDEFDNRRNPSGYQGKVTVQLQAEPQFSQNAIPYVVQLEDELKQKSAAFNGKVVMPPATNIVVAQPSASVRAGDMLDKLHVAMDRLDTIPVMDKIKVNLLGPDNVSFSSMANDDKGVREIRFKVLDGRGRLVGFQSLTGLGKQWQGTSQTFSLCGGSFRVFAQAVDTAGNTSKEQRASFVLNGETMELPELQEPPFIASGPDSQLPSAANPLQSTITTFDQPLLPQETTPYQNQIPPPQPSPYQTQSPPFQTTAPFQPPPLPPPMPNDPGFGTPWQPPVR